MPITTVPAKTSISRRTIQLKPIISSRRMATISLHHSRTIPTRTHRSSPCRICPGTQGNNIPGVRTAMVSHMVSRLPTVRPSPHMARPLPLTGSRLSLRNLHSPSTASRRTDLRITHNRRRPLLSGADSAPIHAVRIQSATNLRAADLLSGDPTAARLWLRAEVEDRRRPARPVPRHPRRAQLLSGIYRQGRGPAVADPDRMDHPHRTDHSGIWALIEAVLILCSSYGSNWHRDGHGQELQD